MIFKSRAIPLFSILLALSACNGTDSSRSAARENGPDTATPDDNTPSLTAKWTFELSTVGKGVATHPQTGEIYYSVRAFGSGPFSRTGGLMVFSPSGKKLREVPAVIPSGKSFNPNAPLVREDGGAVFLGSYWQDLFRYDTATGEMEEITRVGTVASADISIGLDENSALGDEPESVLLAGSQLYLLNMRTGEIRPQAKESYSVRQVVRISQGHYLLNLSDPAQPTGMLALWSGANTRLRVSPVDLSVTAIAVRKKAGMGVIRSGDHCGLVELGVSSAGEVGVARVLAAFDIVGGISPCQDVMLLPVPERGLVVVAAQGGLTLPNHPASGAPSAAVLQIATGKIYTLASRRVNGLALSPDGETLYLSDAKGLQAFQLP